MTKVLTLDEFKARYIAAEITEEVREAFRVWHGLHADEEIDAAVAREYQNYLEGQKT